MPSSDHRKTPFRVHETCMNFNFMQINFSDYNGERAHSRASTRKICIAEETFAAMHESQKTRKLLKSLHRAHKSENSQRKAPFDLMSNFDSEKFHNPLLMHRLRGLQTTRKILNFSIYSSICVRRCNWPTKALDTRA